MKLKLAKSCENAAKSQILRRLVDSKGFDLPCGAGRLGLKRAPGTFPRALGFESPVSYAEIQRPAHRADLCISGGLEGIRTLDPHNANVVRSQLRYEPKY